MVDLRVEFAGIASPNPFWLASGPPTNTYDQVARAFDQGWGGAVWKTIGAPVVNVYGRYGGLDVGAAKLVGLSNIELISDRSIETNLRELALVKRRYPQHAVIASLMVENTCEAWQAMARRAEESGADGLELNFGCPHGMSERGMGSAVGQVPQYCEQIVAWVKEVAHVPVWAKLTPNVADICQPARAAAAGGADGLSLINTVNSIIGIDLDTMAPQPHVAMLGTHGGYCGPAVKPIALHMVRSVAADPALSGLAISAIGGIATWSDAAEFIALGATTVQVCTAVMHHGFRIVEDLTDGLSRWMGAKGYASLAAWRGAALAHVTEWHNLDLNAHTAASLDAAKCIGCGRCFVACRDGGHQAMRWAARPGLTPAPTAPGVVAPRVEVMAERCVGCNLCALVCPVSGCITMRPVRPGHLPGTWAQVQTDPARLAARPPRD